ncbi:3-alpha,7-alpha,12-alpha-trihydroxy-5-beta-cholest-24-enoyl-CoA hydratase (plasmid) [Tomitella fengzijianii]|uniref:3-alpha,7-alpha, 12-alpha-trihydroxy-5-beta-cholest-24-enoyl-CoA hydratase n=1 Tax=Tomitella fengzijianii TaxID=2597660 RepID=A0A516X8X5_9ACTN|nr:MaoC/PaaZ C-terminal domain-containing protein [Tomitella fengzijianii]QDQ99508.1 3-alpha,7-alpha,12-alpha-trihydroxy-5-beta-cholest-24-enoyl-CoA hydratase [Tomitella fengzijianii]
MPIDIEAAVTAEPPAQTLRWTERDVLLYHLSIGAGADPTAPVEQRWVNERHLQVFPSFALVAGKGISAVSSQGPQVLPGIDVAPAKLLHAGQSLELHHPISPNGTALITSRVTRVWDTASAAIIEMQSAATKENGRPWWTSTARVWAGGERGRTGTAPPPQRTVPSRPPDVVLDRKTRADQALLYRLNGGMNPLHVDPTVARNAGFERPTMHGLATYGIVYKALVDELLGGATEHAGSLSVRFSDFLLPGDSIRICVWIEATELLFSATCPERGHAPVLKNGALTLAAAARSSQADLLGQGAIERRVDRLMSQS